MSLPAAVLFNDDLDLRGGDGADALAVQGVRAAAEAVAASLRERGFQARLVPVGGSAREAFELAASLRGELAFNLVEALGGVSGHETGFAWLLELAEVAYTGAPPRALELCLDKSVARAVLAARGLPVPPAAVLERGDEPLDAVPFPAIVKPVREDASHGIGRASVVADAAAARERAAWVRERFGQPALVERFVDGREVNAGLVADGERVALLPLSEIDFRGFAPGVPRVVTYESKWVEGSEDWNATAVAPARLSVEETRRVEQVALGAWRALGLRDYARVDLRLDARGRPFVIDVNPNPDLSPGAGFASAAARAGISHAGLVECIARQALGRAGAAAAAARN